jgi:N-acetylneuraminic acid mutarotase
MIVIILLIVSQIYNCDAWSGIVMDGYNGGNTQLYVPGNSSSNTPNINFGLSHLLGQAAVMLDGSAYFIGGAHNDKTTNAVTIFNPSTNTSTTGASLNVARQYHAATIVGDTIIVCGGWNGSSDSSIVSCEQYNPPTQKWNMITSLPTPTSYFAMVTLNNHAYTFGTRGECVSAPPPVYMFDGQNWKPKSSIAGLPYEYHAGVAFDADRALICGGYAYKGGSCQDSVSACFIYSASSDSWTQAASMAQIRCGHSIVTFEGERSKTVLKSCNNKITDQIYIFGSDPNCGDSTTVELYSLTAGGKILPKRIVGDYAMAAVAIGKSDVTNLCEESYST